MFKPEKYTPPKFDSEPFISFPDVTTEKAGDGYIPENFYATTIYPEYFKISGEWKMLTGSRMDCSVVIKDGMPYAVEMRNIKKGDEVVVNRTDDGRDGIFVHADGFSAPENSVDQAFAFRMGQSRETSYSRDYDRLYDILRYDRDHGKIVWVLGPACVFDHDSRAAMESLINNGYCDALFAGNALATHDLEGDLFHTGLGQDIYTKHNVPNGHYHHLHTINLVRKAGGIKNYVEQNNVRTGIMQALVRNNIPYVLAGSIRDDGPLPDVIPNVYDAQDAMRKHTSEATTVIALATQLHTIATGNMTPSYQVVDGVVRPVYFYVVDVSEFAVNKLKDRGSLSITGVVTNIQDFIVNAERNLIVGDGK
jgi:lysine-ketoglutarate reductase/saccharopine dehydrogenase-like protein (TIGR00300 family)